MIDPLTVALEIHSTGTYPSTSAVLLWMDTYLGTQVPTVCAPPSVNAPPLQHFFFLLTVEYLCR